MFEGLRNIILVSVGAPFTVVAVPLLVLLLQSPVTTALFLDVRGNRVLISISEIEEVRLGGLPQYV